MSNSFNFIRHAIREMILSENYNVSIVGTPVAAKREEVSDAEGKKKSPRKKRGEEVAAEILSNFILTSDDLKDLISVAKDKDILKDYAENDAEIKRRLDLISSRVSPTAGKLAALVVNQMSDAEKSKYLHNMPGPDQTVSGEIHPVVKEDEFKVYDIPGFLNDLAMVKKPGGHGESIGRGEALSILMFGRDDNADKEPDMIIRGKGFSVKYFSSNSKTVNPGADLSATPAYSRIVEVTMRLKKIANSKDIDTGSSDKYISRGQVRNMLQQLNAKLESGWTYAKRADLDPSGIGDEDVNLPFTVKEIKDMVDECGALWDGELILSGHNVIALVGTSNLKMYVMPKGTVVAGEIIMSGAVPKVAIASPLAGKVKVSPGDDSSKEQAESEAESDVEE